jgi:hypothetical protein
MGGSDDISLELGTASLLFIDNELHPALKSEKQVIRITILQAIGLSLTDLNNQCILGLVAIYLR